MHNVKHSNTMNMKKKIFALSLIAVSILLCVSCGKKQSNTDIAAIIETENAELSGIDEAKIEENNYQGEYRIQYKNPVNGFKVSGSFWPIYYEESDKTLRGHANFEFISPKGIRYAIGCDTGIFYHVNSFPELAELFKDTIYHNCRNLPKLSEEKVFYLDYKEPVIKDVFYLGDFDVPFYFVDVNFDGEKDLLIRETIMFYDCKILVDKEIDFEVSNEVFKAVEFGFRTDTRIDRKNKEIRTYHGIYNDFCVSFYCFYKFNSKGEPYESKAQYNNLRNSEGFPTDSTLITTYQYRWENEVWTNIGGEEKIVISKE